MFTIKITAFFPRRNRFLRFSLCHFQHFVSFQFGFAGYKFANNFSRTFPLLFAYVHNMNFIYNMYFERTKFCHFQPVQLLLLLFFSFFAGILCSSFNAILLFVIHNDTARERKKNSICKR